MFKKLIIDKFVTVGAYTVHISNIHAESLIDNILIHHLQQT